MPHELDVGVTGILTVKDCETGSLAPTSACLYHFKLILYVILYFQHETLLHGIVYTWAMSFYTSCIVINTYLCILYTHLLLQAHFSCHGAKGQVASFLLGHIERQTIIRKLITAKFNSPNVISFGLLEEAGILKRTNADTGRTCKPQTQRPQGLGIEPATMRQQYCIKYIDYKNQFIYPKYVG